MKTLLLLLILACEFTRVAAADELQAQFDMFAPTEMSPNWKPNPALWRELRTTRTNPAVSVGGNEFRMSGPLVGAYQTARRSAGERPSLGETLIAIPIGVLSLFVPQPMPRPPESGGRYFAWGERAEAWGTQMGAAADGDGLISFSW